MSWELIHKHLIHTSDSVMKEISPSPNSSWPPKTKKSPCTICYTAKINFPPKVTTVDTTNLQLEEPIHVALDFYNLTSIRGFNSILTAAFSKTRILWVFNTASKKVLSKSYLLHINNI